MSKKLFYWVLAILVLAAGVASYKFLYSEKQSRLSRFQRDGQVPSPAEIDKKQEEFIDNILIVRQLDKKLIDQKIEDGKKYLFRMIDEKENGVHKYYYALNDTFENRLHTTYTSTLTFTLLNLYDLKKDDLLLKQALKCAEFILSMQNKEKGSKGYGAFYYSYYLGNKEKEKRFVVGTTSKTIYTLLKLYKLTDNRKYLESAELAADWLMTMQEANGSMKSYIRYNEEGKWVHDTRESILYNGEVLSALSRIYTVTGKEEYYKTAEKIAQYFAKKYEAAGRSYIIGEYRPKNPISNSWVVMSLMDFYKTKEDDYYKDIVFELSSQIISHQAKDPNDILNYGRIDGAYSTSGNGWIGEVMAGVYEFCLKENSPHVPLPAGRAGNDCQKYKNTVLNIIRWLAQYTYSKENSSFLKNPEKAIGGIFWNKEYKYVRTDSVAHALNGYIGIINYLEDKVLISIPNP